MPAWALPGLQTRLLPAFRSQLKFQLLQDTLVSHPVCLSPTGLLGLSIAPIPFLNVLYPALSPVWKLPKGQEHNDVL